MRGMSSRVKDEFCLTVVGFLLFRNHVIQELEAFLQITDSSFLLFVFRTH